MEEDNRTSPVDIDKIVANYSELVYQLAYAQMRNKNDADDIYQEVFLRYIRKKPVLKNEEHEKAWFIRVTINCCRNLWSTAFRRHTRPLEYAQTESHSEEAAAEEELKDLLDRLPKAYRVVIHLFYYEDMSTAQISALLGQKETTVRVKLTRARRMLKDLMEGEEEYAEQGV